MGASLTLHEPVQSKSGRPIGGARTFSPQKGILRLRIRRVPCGYGSGTFRTAQRAELFSMGTGREFSATGEVQERLHVHQSEGPYMTPIRLLPTCYGLNACVPQNSSVEALTPNVVVLGGGALMGIRFR